MSRTKKQHFVPRFYLAHFVSVDGSIWTYEKGRTEGFPRPPEETAVETNFYSVKDKDGTYFDDIEAWLSDVESKAAPIYPKLARGERLTESERDIFSVFVASLYTRSPSIVHSSALLYGEMAKKVVDFSTLSRDRFEAMMNKIDREHGDSTSTRMRDKLFDFFGRPRSIQMNVDKHVGLLSFSSTASIAKIFYDMHWIVVRCRDQHLITSDSPVVRIVPNEFWHPMYGDGGFMNKHVFVTLPLAPNLMLEMCWSGRHINKLVDVDKQRGRLYNKQRAGFSEKYLYSSRMDAGIASLGMKFASPGVRLDFGPGSEMPVELVRTLGR